MIGFAGGLNLYGYVGGNPTNAVDPSGLAPFLYINRNHQAGSSHWNGDPNDDPAFRVYAPHFAVPKIGRPKIAMPKISMPEPDWPWELNLPTPLWRMNPDCGKYTDDPTWKQLNSKNRQRIIGMAIYDREMAKQAAADAYQQWKQHPYKTVPWGDPSHPDKLPPKQWMETKSAADVPIPPPPDSSRDFDYFVRRRLYILRQHQR